ncbi:MAG: TIR domain-containing protein [Planctomycetales bacterium]|jgi:hypothetical protein
MQERPSLFIGSSAEGLPVAEAIQQNFDRVCETVIWSQGVFGLGDGTLETLVETLPNFDFSILVLTPDDLTESRDNLQQTPRDNVLLELGLCIGFLGRKRTFAVYDRTSGLKLPSDLAGVTIADYQPQSTGNFQAALGAASTSIKNVITELGKRSREPISASVDTSTQFQIIHDLMDAAGEQFIILMYESGTPLQIDSSTFSAGRKYRYQCADQSGGQGYFSASKLCEQLPDADLLDLDLRRNVTLTERGRDFADWLVKRGHKADWFETPMGGWGDKPDGFEDWGSQPPPAS